LRRTQSDCTPNCPKSALSSRCRSGEDLLVVCLRPIQESAFLRWIAQGNRYCAGCLDSGKDGQNLFLRLQTVKNGTALRRQPPKIVKQRSEEHCLPGRRWASRRISLPLPPKRGARFQAKGCGSSSSDFNTGSRGHQLRLDRGL